MSTAICGVTREVIEWNYFSSKLHHDPFNQIELDVIVTHEDGESWVIPAFWAGGQEWKVRFAAPRCGTYEAISKCSDSNDSQLHEVNQSLSISKYEGDNPLYEYGPLQIDISRQNFEHADGTPFFWLGDTWWMGLCKRLSWEEDFKLLTADRTKKGFSVIQIVAGLYPDMDSFDARGENEAGFPWEKDYATINPAYFDMADQRIDWLVRSGLIPCILGSWGYYLFPLGIDKMKQHWRYLIARWGAYPVIWTLAGETNMPYYLSKSRQKDQEQLREGWSEVGRYIKEIDPYSRLLTVHPIHIGRDQVIDSSIMDFDMLQTDHFGKTSIEKTLKTLTTQLDRKPKMPVVVAEVNYEGILNSNYSDIQRLSFWSSFMSGANGYTYGANGLWQVNECKKPFGNSPNGSNWGDTSWKEAYKLDGGGQLGLAVKLLQKYEWWDFEFHPEWLSVGGDKDNINVPFATGIPSKIRIIYYDASKFDRGNGSSKAMHILYSYVQRFLGRDKPLKIVNIELDIKYNAYFWDPRNAERHDIGLVKIDHNSEWRVPMPPTLEDWILILEARS